MTENHCFQMEKGIQGKNVKVFIRTRWDEFFNLILYWILSAGHKWLNMYYIINGLSLIDFKWSVLGPLILITADW